MSKKIAAKIIFKSNAINMECPFNVKKLLGIGFADP